MHGLDTSNVSSRVESSQVEFEPMYVCAVVLAHLLTRKCFSCLFCTPCICVFVQSSVVAAAEDVWLKEKITGEITCSVIRLCRYCELHSTLCCCQGCLRLKSADD